MVHYFSVLNGTRPLTCMHNVLVPNFAKRAGKRVPSPLLVVINNQKNKINSPSHMVPEKSDKTLASDKQRRRGMFSFLYGSRS